MANNFHIYLQNCKENRKINIKQFFPWSQKIGEDFSVNLTSKSELSNKMEIFFKLFVYQITRPNKWIWNMLVSRSKGYNIVPD